MGLDIQDEMGRHEVSFQENIDRTPTEDGGNESYLTSWASAAASKLGVGGIHYTSVYAYTDYI